MGLTAIQKPGNLDWDQMLLSLPGCHLLQTWEWAKFKEEYGWKKNPIVWMDTEGKYHAAALILERKMGFRIPGLDFKILYVPRGPALDWNNLELVQTVMNDLKTLAIKERAIFIKIDGELITEIGEPESEGWASDRTTPDILLWMEKNGWVHSNEQIQFANTVWVDLTLPEDKILARMKQKTRYNIRLAQKKGVRTRRGGPQDFQVLYKMYAETSLRDGFVIRNWGYYKRLWDQFYQAGMLDPLIAEVNGEAVAGLMLFHFGNRSWYLYGMSTARHRDKMPNYLLQWAAICRSKELGCGIYDLWGAPTRFVEEDPLWQVYRFKEGFAGKVICTSGAWDFPTSKLIYFLYMKILPRILSLLRRRGRGQTRQEAGL